MLACLLSPDSDRFTPRERAALEFFDRFFAECEPVIG